MLKTKKESLSKYLNNNKDFITISNKKELLKIIENANIINREVSIITDKKIHGIIKDVSEVEIVISNGSWENKISIDLDLIKEIEISVYPYYSMKHKAALRQAKKPLREFRYSEQEIKDLKNQYVLINYDGKFLEGKVTKINYKNENEAGLTILLKNGEIKFIETYRLRGLEITGNLTNHLRLKRIKSFENEISEDLNHYKQYIKIEPDIIEVNASTMLEKYFEAIIDYHEGKKVDLADFDYDWIKEVKLNEDYKGMNENEYRINLAKAKKLNEFYDKRKEFIRKIVKKAENIDWTEYGVNQLQGEMSALRYVYESDVIYN